MAESFRRELETEEGVEDMINLSDLNEHIILHNLRTRYGRDHIYTYVGSILVAVNPYRTFNIYGLDMVKLYECQQLENLPPHLFAIGSASYSKMIKEKENQVLVISGESGAGKTESTKLIMQYLAAVNKSNNNLITEQILEANPLLESFGNAKTIRNDNSSRFGKYIEVFFKNGGIVGAKTSEYLLEKSRIVTQAPEERNYHIFYEMLEALTDDQKSQLGLQTAPKYFYLNQGGSCVIPGRDDAENFRKALAAMEIMDFTREEQDTVKKILASVLHIGNVYFKNVQENNHETVILGSEAEIKWVSHLLLLSDEWLKQALTSKITEARGERVVSPYNLDQALDARDAIAKALYSRLFTWLVERVNLIVCRAEREKTTSLAVLDIFGFEDFHHNSFEQLCINYANETLQYFFNQHIFQLEQREYIKEKIKWQHIQFKDNQPVIDLIATKPTGILHILDDECNFPQSRDQSFLEKCHFHHSTNLLYDKPRMSDPEFYIIHYAGRIKYNVLHFLEKNKDTLRSDVVELMCESKNKLIAQMFADLRDRQITKTLSKTTGRYVTMKPRTPTVAASFNESLLSLIDSMSRCHPFFVRCIKPNVHKQAMQFEDPVVMDQLRYTGMLETIRIRKTGYPVRLKFPVFIQRYRCLLKGTTIRQSQLPSEACALILSTLGPSHKDEYQIGATKVFMKETFEAVINREAEKIQRVAAVCIQTHARAYLVRCKFLKARAASNSIQRMIRMWRARRHFLATRNGIIKAQAQFRMFRQRRQYLQKREEIRRKLEEQKIARRRQEAHEKLEREQRPQPFVNTPERAARNMASVANLEVPGELAFVYSKLDEWRLPHDGVNIMAAAGDVQAMDMGYRLPVDINSHSFSKFTSVYFREPHWGVKMEPIKSSLTNLQSDDLVYKSLSLFKLILRYMCEENMTDKREKILSDYIVQMGLQNEGLRDELLCQVANQAWQNQNAEQTERIWRLMASCLSCLMPSSSLFKYLLKFVSDVAVNGYKIVCQHKVLQSANLAPQLSRVYPPCFLEWLAIQRKASMALEAKFPDDINVIGHVESWTSGELFTSHLLKQRGLTENTQGWTVILQEDVERYELMGYDYVLDLISEIEIAPGFPTCKAYFLVSTDKNQDRLHRKHHHEGPHSELERFLLLMPPMPEMLKRTVPPVAPGASGGHKTPTAEELGFSTTSILNQRPTEIFISELSDSRMNARYTKRRAPVPPTNGHISNGHAHGAMNGSALNGDMSTIDENDEDMGLSHTQINARYFPDVASNGVNEDLSTSKLNQRYTKNFSGQGVRNKTGVKDQIRKKYSGVSGVSAADVHSVTSEHSDWSHWVEDVFDTVLNEHIDDAASDGKSLHTRIKGGGKGVPGLQAQKSYKQKSAVQYAGNESSLELNQIRNVHSGTSSLRARDASLVKSNISDWHQWVGDTFESVLSNEHMADTASIGQSLHTRIKGGGRGVPGLQTQQTIIPPPLNLGLGLTTPASVVAPPMISPGFTFNSQLTPGLQPPQDALQQLLNQQAMQQQQAALQAVLLDQQRQQQAALLQAALQQQQQQQQNYVAQAAAAQQLAAQQAAAQQLVFQQAAAQQVAAQQAAVHQVAAQQAAVHQVAAQQAAVHQVAAQQAAVHQVAAQQAAVQQAAVQQVASLQTALQQTELENRLLKQSIERENLKKQLQQIQGQTSPPSAGFQTTTFASAQAAGLSPDNSYSSTILMPPGSQITSGERFHVPYGSSEMVTATSSSKEGPPVAPKRVHLIKSSFENQPSASYGFQQSGKTVGVAKTTKTVTFNTTTTVQQSHPELAAATSLFGKQSSSPPPSISPPSPPSPPPPAAHPPIPPSPPPSPPPHQVIDSSVHISESIYVDARTPAPPLHSQPVAPPPSPPPLPPISTIPLGLEIDKEKGTFTVRDKSGRARTVRIGKVVWPPPSEEIHKQEVQVGKLEIDEKVAKGIENRIIGKRKWQKPVVPEDEPKSILKRSNVESTRRAKSLIETGHSETLKLLERKLGGSAKTQMDDASVSTKLPGQSVGLQTTNTLRKMQNSALVQANESVYATFIEKDEPPPPPKAPPPQLKIRKKETVEVEEKFETVLQTDQRESFETRIEPDVEQKPLIDYASFERAITELYPQNKKYFLMYSKVPWSLLIRKEVFWPSERLDNSTILHLVYCQVVQDVFNNACVRISKEQRIKMRSMLDGHGVEKSNYLIKELSLQVKKVIVDTAKEWPTYFCRLFPIACIGHYADVRYLGISHTGLRFVTRERSVVEDHLTVVEEFRFEDVVDTVMPTSTSVQLNLRTKSLIFQTIRPKQLKDMVDRFCQESEKGNKFVVAVKDYITRESTLLSFKNGDIIKLMDPEMNLERGWLYGSLNGIVGLFPEEYVRPLARHEVENSSMKPKLYQPPPQHGRPLSREGPPPDNYSETSQGTVVHDGKYSMMEFAILHFRESLDKQEYYRQTDPGNQEWSWKEQADMIKWTRSPIQASLLKLSSSELNKLALECFISIMRFMGDYPMGSNQTDFDCVMKILRTCHKYPDLRDEVYCQLCKQTTNNRSMKGKSKNRGWRLFGLVAAYCDCSEMLRPYLFKYLETTASDVNRTYNYAAALCLQNLRKTFKYGGRKNVPLREEVQALADGRNSKRLPFYYSGTDTQGGLLQVKSCTVVGDAIMDVCSELNIIDPVEMEEYTLFVRTEEGLFTKLNREEYILDITAEFIRKKISYDLIFQRTVWIFPLSHMDNEVYVDVMFHQCIFDYIDGLNVVWPRGELEPATVDDMETIGALLHRANDYVGLPTQKQLELLVPKTVQNGPLMRPQQWLNRIQDKLRDITGHSSLQAKALFLEILCRWPLFGSTFFLIRSIPNTTGECKLVVNKRGIAFLHKDTHETLLAHPFSEILSTRRYRSESGHNYLDMKIGDLMVQKVLRIETDQGSDISSLIAQYMQVLNRGNKRYSQRL